MDFGKIELAKVEKAVKNANAEVLQAVKQIEDTLNQYPHLRDNPEMCEYMNTLYDIIKRNEISFEKIANG